MLRELLKRWFPPKEADILRWHREFALREGVPSDIHKDDFIYRFVFNNHAFKNKKEAIGYYFTDGGKSATKLVHLLQELKIDTSQRVALLEFASGYGCVTRHLHKYPFFDLESCDIHPEAIRFLTDKFNVKSILSVSSPLEFSTARTYDVVFALSFFSHMPRRTFGPWLKSLFNVVKPNGVLCFTTHGLASRKYLGNMEIPPDGFWFKPESEQSDLSTVDYGLTLTTPEFVRDAIKQHTGQGVHLEKTAYWWDHQDLYVVKKE